MATWYRECVAHVRQRANVRIRGAAGLNTTPPPRCNDPSGAYSDVYGVARVVHGDLPAMLVGGLGSLFFQMLHPLAMAGVAQHSRYQDDPLGRLLQTANFISATTYGSKATAAQAIERVLNVHTHVHGVAEDGRTYDANDPHLLLWVHCAEIYMFLHSYRRFGSIRLSDSNADRYVEEMMPLARDLGLMNPPRDVAELTATLNDFRGELRLSSDGVIARDFVAHSVVKSRTQRLVYRLFVLSAWSLLPEWAADKLGVSTNVFRDRPVVRPATKALSVLFRLAVPAPRQVAMESPPSTTTI
ncbi:MAG: oxygenase MpaB family protein [Acidimicrobiales bacterium]